MKVHRQSILLRLFLVLFILCLMMVFITDPGSAQFYVMIISCIVNFIMIIISSIKLRKKGKQ